MRDPSSLLSFGFPAKAKLAASLAALLLAGCSSSIDRFADYPGASDKTYTASAPSTGSASGDDAIQSGPIADASGNRNQAQRQYTPPDYQPSGRYENSAANNAASGGSVVVAPGQTLYSIARASGKSVQSVASANGISAPYHVKAGQRILIPGGARSLDKVELARAPASGNPVRGTSVHAVRSGDTLFSLGRRYRLHPYAIADLNGLSHNSPLRLGQKVRIPDAGKQLASAPSIPDEPSVVEDDAPDGFEENRAGDLDASPSDSGKSQQRLDEEPSAESDEAPLDEPSFPEESVPAAEPTQSFRWPVKG
ncbi:MAG: LysM peptidoglycan-binding domain-containing protein, partial [Pseudomonadota bacterium]|nr:LysM peptidoglycan-binding domain-containing protein [Pseudomonadota bacterium]